MSSRHGHKDPCTVWVSQNMGQGTEWWEEDPACPVLVLAPSLYSNLLERILKERLPGNADLHMAGQGI